MGRWIYQRPADCCDPTERVVACHSDLSPIFPFTRTIVDRFDICFVPAEVSWSSSTSNGESWRMRRCCTHENKRDKLEACPTLPLSKRYVSTLDHTQTGSLCSVAWRKNTSADYDVFSTAEEGRLSDLSPKLLLNSL